MFKCHCLFHLLEEEDSKKLRDRVNRNILKFNESKCVQQPWLNTDWDLTGWVAALRERTWRSSWTTGWTQGLSRSIARCYCNFAKPRTGLLGAQRPARQGKLLIILLYLARGRLHLKYCTEFGAPELNKDVEKLKRAQQKSCGECQRLEHVSRRGGWGIRAGFVW